MQDVGNIDVFPWIRTSSNRPMSFFKDFVLDKRPRNLTDDPRLMSI